MSALPASTTSIMEVVLRRVSSPSFVGRAEELALLDSALARTPAFTFVAGESGVGKSRLVSEFEERAEIPVLVGHCLELGGTTFPYAPIAEALRPLGESVPDGASQPHVFEALLALLHRLGPVALVIEDLHWADPSTRDFLVFLVRSARTEPLFLLATYRSDELHRRHPLRPVLAELERAPRVERIALERFTRTEVSEQLTGILGDEPDSGLADRLYARAQGNALYTEELLAASADSGELPATLRDALLGRFERLPAAAQEVVRVAAVAERPIGHALLEAVLPPDDVIEGAREAVAHHVLVTHPDGTYAFRHALVGEAIYEDLLPGERTALHAALARAMEGDPTAAAAELACHWQGAHDLPRALAASVAAGTEARRLHAPGEALRHFEDALALWDRVPDAAERAGMPRSAVLRAAGAAANDGFESARAIALMREAIADAEGADRIELARMHSELAHYLRHANQHDASDEEVRRALELLPDGRAARARAAARSELEEPEPARPLPRGRARGARDGRRGAAAGRARPRGGRGQYGGHLARRARPRRGRRGAAAAGARPGARDRLAVRAVAGGGQPVRAARPVRPHRGGVGRGASLAAGHLRPPGALALRHLPRAPGRVPAPAARAHGGGGRGDARPRSQRGDHLDGHVLRLDARDPRPACAARTRPRAPRSTSCAEPCRPTGTRSGSRCSSR